MSSDYAGSNILSHLRGPIYVISMNWPRMGKDARRKWLVRLRHACQETIIAIEAQLQRMDSE